MVSFCVRMQRMCSRVFSERGYAWLPRRGVGTNIRSEKAFIKIRFLQLLLGSPGRDGLEAGVGL
jgi:hypothetical protein